MDFSWLTNLFGGGGLGATAPAAGATPAFNPQAMGPPQAGAATQKPFLDRLSSAMFLAPSGVDPAEAQAYQRNAMLQMGLGMLAASQSGQGLGAGIFNSYAGAANSYQGAMDRAYRQTEAKRIEGKQDKRYSDEQARDDKRRTEDLDWRQKEADRIAKAEQARLAQAAKIASLGREDDSARARYTRLQADELQGRLEEQNRLAAKVANGTATAEERNLYQMLRTGRQPAANPYAAFMDQLGGGMGGYGGGMPPPGGNPLLTDPRL